MIICTKEALAVGDYRRGPTTDANMNYYDLAFVVIRETTEDEYRQFAAEHAPHHPFTPFTRPMRFYVVSTD